ncbi:hypothetical protein HAZT_HAZT010168 [Hyalella azteca]|uniref:Uncharacterized protein n=1 Tax=Hyalella azteca TaxID=294128 RepID=A0A6A0GUI7_HYAAZ|nr:hypothetical protein HAZT_HAZT010168 [Hyalella azteca]
MCSYSHKKNIKYSGDEVERMVEDEFKLFKKAGGGTIVENTITGIERNLLACKRLMKATDVNIIAGTGFYVSPSLPSSVLAMSTEQLCEVILKEVTQGCDEDPTIRCGIIGEIGSSWPITDFERRSIRAAGITQEQTGAPVMFHPGRHHDAPAEILRVYAEAGGDIRHAVMAHLDRELCHISCRLNSAS